MAIIQRFDSGAYEFATNSISLNLSGSNYLVVCFSGGYSTTVSNVKYNGVNLTRIVKEVYNNAFAEIWVLLNPASGSNTFQFAYSGTPGYAAHWNVLGLSGVKGVRDFDTSSGTLTNRSVVLTTENNDLAIDALGIVGGASYTVGTGQTDFMHESRSGASYEAATTTTVTMSWTIAFTADNALAALSLEPKRLSAGLIWWMGGLGFGRLFGSAILGAKSKILCPSHKSFFESGKFPRIMTAAKVR